MINEALMESLISISAFEKTSLGKHDNVIEILKAYVRA